MTQTANQSVLEWGNQNLEDSTSVDRADAQLLAPIDALTSVALSLFHYREQLLRTDPEQASEQTEFCAGLARAVFDAGSRLAAGQEPRAEAAEIGAYADSFAAVFGPALGEETAANLGRRLAAARGSERLLEALNRADEAEVDRSGIGRRYALRRLDHAARMFEDIAVAGRSRGHRSSLRAAG